MFFSRSKPLTVLSLLPDWTKHGRCTVCRNVQQTAADSGFLPYSLDEKKNKPCAIPTKDASNDGSNLQNQSDEDVAHPAIVLYISLLLARTQTLSEQIERQGWVCTMVLQRACMDLQGLCMCGRSACFCFICIYSCSGRARMRILLAFCGWQDAAGAQTLGAPQIRLLRFCTPVLNSPKKSNIQLCTDYQAGQHALA